MYEIRIHGRGGQGAVTAAQILAIAAFYEGKETQAFPRFGTERRGAPVEAFTRIDDKKIYLRSAVYNPDIVIVLDPSLLSSVNVTEGLKKNGKIIINSSKSPKELGIKDFKVYTVDVSSIALKIFGANMVNTAMLGALAAISGLFSLDSLNKAIEDRFKDKKDVIEKNKQAIKEVYEKLK